MDLKEDDSRVVYAVLQHLYGIRYTVPLKCDYVPLFHVSVYAAGEFYQLPDLKRLARHYLKNLTSTFTNNRTQCLEAVEAVYNTTPSTDRGLRDIVVETVAKDIELINSKATDATVLRVPEFALDLLRHKPVPSPSKGNGSLQYKCTDCDLTFEVNDNASKQDMKGLRTVCPRQPSAGPAHYVKPEPSVLGRPKLTPKTSQGSAFLFGQRLGNPNDV